MFAYLGHSKDQWFWMGSSLWKWNT